MSISNIHFPTRIRNGTMALYTATAMPFINPTDQETNANFRLMKYNHNGRCAHTRISQQNPYETRASEKGLFWPKIAWILTLAWNVYKIFAYGLIMPVLEQYRTGTRVCVLRNVLKISARNVVNRSQPVAAVVCIPNKSILQLDANCQAARINEIQFENSFCAHCHRALWWCLWEFCVCDTLSLSGYQCKYNENNVSFVWPPNNGQLNRSKNGI